MRLALQRLVPVGFGLAANLALPTLGYADCPRYRAPQAKFLLSTTPFVFTAEIVSGRLAGSISELTDDNSAPTFEETLEVLDVIQGRAPERLTLKVASPCDSAADCFRTPDQANAYERSRVGHTILALVATAMDKNNRPILVLMTCPSLPDVDLTGKNAQALTAAMKQIATKARN